MTFSRPTESLERLPEPQEQPLPTMYDLPSEDPEEPGLPDEFHALQPQLLSATLSLPNQAPESYFTGMDLNLYYDPHHTQWYKRPDWFLALGAGRLYRGRELRESYVVWDEPANPFLVVELLSPGTEAEDLGERFPRPGRPPGKWQVYEQILQIPYYFVFDRYRNSQGLRGFKWESGGYEAVAIAQQRYWVEELALGLGVWEGTYQGIDHRWLRWYTAAGDWLPTPAERAEQEHQRAEQERQRAEQERQRAEQECQRAEQERQRAEQECQRAERLAARLRALGIDPEDEVL